MPRWPYDDALGPGTLVGRHRIRGRLAEGTHALLYVGEHVVTRAEVAIKVLRHADARHAGVLARFDREARVMGRLSGCPTIVQVHDAGELHDGRRFLVMELVHGPELAALLAHASRRGAPLELARIIAIAGDLAAALRDAHAKGVVHRDLKPSNVVVARGSDGRELAKLVDFGVSADLELDDAAAPLTGAGAPMGTPEYMAPEQAAGLPATVAMDLFALGVVMHEMTTGVLPTAQVLRRGQAPRIATLRRGVPAALDTLVSRCLCVDPRARIGDAAAVLVGLMAARDQLEGGKASHVWIGGRPVRAAGEIDLGAVPPDPEPDPSAVRTRVLPTRRRPPFAAVLLVVAVIGFGALAGVVIWWLGPRT